MHEILTDGISVTAQHYTLFPLPLGQLLRSQAITELHLNLNSGKWDYDTWGSPQSSGVGSGAELWVWMADGSKQTCVKTSILVT